MTARRHMIAERDHRTPGERVSGAMTDVHPADPADDLTAGTSDDPAPEDAEPDAAPTVVDEAADAEGGTPGEGGGGAHPLEADVDALQTVDHGRETDAARRDTSDSTPTPTETPAG
jgi:hypothetical protein